jgi:hypothetical protein
MIDLFKLHTSTCSTVFISHSTTWSKNTYIANKEIVTLCDIITILGCDNRTICSIAATGTPLVIINKTNQTSNERLSMEYYNKLGIKNETDKFTNYIPENLNNIEHMVHRLRLLLQI